MDAPVNVRGDATRADGRRVLVVDDDVDFANGLRDLLESRGYTIEIANDARAASKAAKTFDPEVALLDIRLGRTSGVDLAADLKRRRPDLICIMVTAYAEIDSAVGALRAGTDDYLRKPFQPAELFATLERASANLRLLREKQAAEDALKASELRLRAVLDNVADCVITIDEEGCIESFNPAAELTFGYAADDAIGRNVEMLMAADDRKRHRSQMRHYLDAGEASFIGKGPREVTGLRSDGSTIPLEIVVSEMTIAGERRFIGAIRDITEQKRTHAQLIQASKLATLGEMAAGMAHEINQPLNVIRMAADSAIERIEEGEVDGGFLSTKLGRISAQTQRAARIFDHMRIFGREGSEKPEAFDPRQVVNDALGLVGQQLRLSSIEVEATVAECCRKVLGNAEQLEQVLINLIANARDAIEANRDAPGNPRKISLIVEDAGRENKVKLTVRDTGGGIPEATISRIFDPFFTTKEVGQGTGLGLSVSYGIISDMGGAIEAVSTPDGAVFTIVLPAVAEQRPAA